MRWGYALVVAAPALLLAVIGLVHPYGGSEDNATLWRNLHLLLLPIFPLLGVAIWVLLRGVPGVLAWTARVAAFGYATFYSGLDILTGIGVGALLERQSDVQAIEAVGAAGRDLGRVGGVFFIVACVAISLVLVKRVGRAAIPGAVVLVIAAVVFGARHINGAAGVLAMLALAAGFAWLAAVSSRSEPTESQDLRDLDEPPHGIAPDRSIPRRSIRAPAGSSAGAVDQPPTLLFDESRSSPPKQNWNTAAESPSPL